MQQAATASPAAAKRVLIGGGSGFIGQALSKHLLNTGCEVTLISRNPARVGGAGLPAISWANLADPSFTLASYDAVVNLAGVSLNRPAWIETYKDQIVSSRVDTTRAIVKAIENTAQNNNKPPKVFVVGSAVGYYPSGTPGPEVDEYYSEPPPSTFFGDLVRQLEDEAKTLVQNQQNTRLAFVRTGVVLGKNGGAFPSLKRSTGFYIGSGEQWFPWIHINDIVGIFSHAIHNEQCSGPLNGAAPGIVTAKGYFSSSFSSTARSGPVFLILVCVFIFTFLNCLVVDLYGNQYANII
ncbi:Short chain dehydrogenase/reductase family 39U member 1 [Balamuthia mandrillaris]